MDLQTRKIEFVQAFLKLESEKVISHFEKLLQKETKTLSDFKPFTTKEFEKRISKSTDDSNNERLTENNDLISEIEKWS
jgi:hypothetical protein